MALPVAALLRAWAPSRLLWPPAVCGYKSLGDPRMLHCSPHLHHLRDSLPTVHALLQPEAVRGPPCDLTGLVSEGPLGNSCPQPLLVLQAASPSAAGLQASDLLIVPQQPVDLRIPLPLIAPCPPAGAAISIEEPPMKSEGGGPGGPLLFRWRPRKSYKQRTMGLPSTKSRRRWAAQRR